MLLREFIYFNREHAEPVEDNRYLSSNDSSILSKKDLRKTRLTLKVIGEIRRAAEVHELERNKELELVRKMYAAPPPESTPPM